MQVAHLPKNFLKYKLLIVDYCFISFNFVYFTASGGSPPLTISCMRLYRVYLVNILRVSNSEHISHSQSEYIALPLGKQYQSLTCKTFIFSFLSRYTYATSDTILSNALPIPNINAIPINVGCQTLVTYKIKAIP